MSKQAYIVRIRRDKLSAAPSDWLEKVKRTPGVEVVGSYGHQARILADDEGISRVRSQFQHVAFIEESTERTPLDPQEGSTKS
jgi:hypothetical protein